MTPRQWAETYREVGWAITPCDGKRPILPEWQRGNGVPIEAFEDRNIGVVLGAVSNGLIDIDLDVPEAAIVADILLPTTATFGRISKPRSHRLYLAPGAVTKRYKTDTVLVELRSDGSQTVLPGSTHPSGEAVEWDEGEETELANADTQIAKLAAATALARGWPQTGARHDAALALAGALLRAKWSEPEILKFVTAVCTGAGDRELDDRLKAVASTVIATGPITGWRTLAELVPYTHHARRWLGIAYDAIRLGPDLARVADEGAALLAGDQTVYQRAGRLVSIVEGREAPVIRELDAFNVLDSLSKGQWEKFDGRNQSWRRCAPSMEIAHIIQKRLGWSTLRDLTGVTETPPMRPDGSLVHECGWDAATGVAYLPREDFPELPHELTRADARGALEELRDVWRDFPWRGAEDRDTMIAALLTVLGRQAIQGAIPLFLVDKSTRGSGGTLACDAVSVIATGRSAPRLGWAKEDVEQEKMLGAMALDGRALVLLDNITGKLGGAVLDRYLTADDTIQTRILGRSELATIRLRTVFLGSANNCSVAHDTARRTLVPRLESPLERPEDRPASSFSHPDLLGWCKKERPFLVACGLMILAAHAQAGRPETDVAAIGSFDAWRRVVACAIAWAGGFDVTMMRAVATQVDEAMAPLGALLGLWQKLWPDGVSATGVVLEIWGGGSIVGPEMVGRRLDLAAIAECLEGLIGFDPRRGLTAARLGRFLSGIRDRVVDGRAMRSGAGRSTLWHISHS